jgi:hypothetical protein
MDTLIFILVTLILELQFLSSSYFYYMDGGDIKLGLGTLNFMRIIMKADKTFMIN